MTVRGTPNYVIYTNKILGSGSTGTVYFARHKVISVIFLLHRKMSKIRNEYSTCPDIFYWDTWKPDVILDFFTLMLWKSVTVLMI